MKNMINHFYNLYPEKVFQNNGIYYFYIADIKFYLILYERSPKELEKLVEITNHLYNNGIMTHTFMITSQNNFTITYNENSYVLIRINTDEKEELDLTDLMNFNQLITSDNTSILYTEDWVNLWSYRVDSFESQIMEYNKEFPLLTDSLNYYVGLAENAISYVKNALNLNPNTESKLYLSHRRIQIPLMYGNLYNPLSFVFDYEVRDVAEYIKAKFFFNELDWDEIEEAIVKLNLSEFKAQLFYARLLYPSYYFDMFEKIIHEEIKEKEIIKITKLSEAYEEFLFDIYNIIKGNAVLPEISWIVEKYK